MPEADKVAACLTARAVAPNPPTGSVSCEPALGGGLASSHKASVTHGEGGGVAACCYMPRRKCVRKFPLSRSPSAVFPLRAHMLYFWPGGGERRQRAREPSMLFQRIH